MSARSARHGDLDRAAAADNDGLDAPVLNSFQNLAENHAEKIAAGCRLAAACVGGTWKRRTLRSWSRRAPRSRPLSKNLSKDIAERASASGRGSGSRRRPSRQHPSENLAKDVAKSAACSERAQGALRAAERGSCGRSAAHQSGNGDPGERRQHLLQDARTHARKFLRLIDDRLARLLRTEDEGKGLISSGEPIWGKRHFRIVEQSREDPSAGPSARTDCPDRRRLMSIASSLRIWPEEAP